MTARDWPSAVDLLTTALNFGGEVFTVTGTVNTIMYVTDDVAGVATSKSPQGRDVPVQDVQRGLDKLREHGKVRVDVATLGNRSSFVGAVLATLPFAQFTKNPACVEVLPDADGH